MEPGFGSVVVLFDGNLPVLPVVRNVVKWESTCVVACCSLRCKDYGYMRLRIISFRGGLCVFVKKNKISVQLSCGLQLKTIEISLL